MANTKAQMGREAARGGYATVRQRERIDPYVQAVEDRKLAEKQASMPYQAQLHKNLAALQDPSKGAMLTINTREGLGAPAGQQGVTEQAARAAGAGAAGATADLNARLAQASESKVRSALAQAQQNASAAKQRELGALSGVGRTKGGAFAGNLAMGGLTGAVNTGVQLGTAGAGKALGLSDELVALQGRNA